MGRLSQSLPATNIDRIGVATVLLELTEESIGKKSLCEAKGCKD